MKPLTSIPQLYRNVRRWTEIVSVLSKYGLADWLKRFHIEFLNARFRGVDGELIADLTYEERIRSALAELGPTFIKFGQLLSTRPDLIGAELAEELSNLQSHAPADSFEDIKDLIEEEFGRPLDEVFESFDSEPIASASIGQVHQAKIREHIISQVLAKEGETAPPREVVVKIRHLGIEKKIETDLDILSGLAHLAERLEDFRAYQPHTLVREISKTLKRELDFCREKNHLDQFRKAFAKDESVVIPEPVAHLSTERVLTMSKLHGTELKKFNRRCKTDLPASEIARHGAELYLKMIFEDGFYHADPHPGNILIQDDGKIGLLDFGMVGRISEYLREDIESLLVAIVGQDVMMLTMLVKRIGNCPIEFDEAAFSNDVADYVGKYSTQVLANFDMSGALRDFIDIVRRYGITLPAEASLLIKVLVTLEGTGKLLDPEFSLMEIMQPYQRTLMLRRLSPVRQMKKMRRFYMQAEQLVDSLPTKVSSILDQVQTGRFDVHLVHRRLGATVNRLVMGLMASAVFLGSALMLSYEVPPVLFPGEGWLGISNLSMFGTMGMLVSISMGLRLTLAIRRSGNLDRSD